MVRHNFRTYQRESNPILHKAVREGDYELVEELIDDEDDLEERDGSGRTPFLCAAFHGQTDILELLWDSDADVTAVDDYERSALHLAAKENHVEALEFLLEVEANALVTDNYGRQPHHLAAYMGSVDTLQILLDLPYVDVDAQDDWLRTPLHIAAKENCDNAVETLLEYDANVYARDNSRRQPHHLAAANGAAESLLKLLEDPYVKKNARDELWRTPLHLAYLYKHKNCQKLLLYYGADPSLTDDYDKIPADLG